LIFAYTPATSDERSTASHSLSATSTQTGGERDGPLEQAVTNFNINDYDAEAIASEELDGHVKGRTAVATPSMALSVRTRSSKRVVAPAPGGHQAYAVEHDKGGARVGEQLGCVNNCGGGGGDGGDNDSVDTQEFITSILHRGHHHHAHVSYDDDGGAQYSLLHSEQAGAVEAEGFLHRAMVGVELGQAAHENIAYGMTSDYPTASAASSDAAAMMPQHLDAYSLGSLTTEQSYDHLFNGYDQLLNPHEQPSLWPTLYSSTA